MQRILGLLVLVLWMIPWTGGRSALAREAADARPVPRIVLYTMGQGEVMFEKFGHAAMCVEYPQRPRMSRCYNYGTTDFSAFGELIWTFLRGQSRFWVSVTTPSRMIERYVGFDRTLWRQELPLTDEQARAIAAHLENEALPENRYYTYHHFYENCTTRLRDIIDRATADPATARSAEPGQPTGGVLSKSAGEPVGPSFREFSRVGFAEQTWYLILSDFVMGRRGDVRPDRWQAMFLPDYLREEVHRHMGVAPVMIYERQGRAFSQDEGLARGWIALIALLVALPMAITRLLGRGERVGVALSAAALFLIAFVLWGLALVSTLGELRYNELLLVFWPSDIVLPFLGAMARRRYARVRVAGLALVSLLAAVGVLQQPLWMPLLIAFVPMLIAAVPSRERATAAAPALASAA